MQIGAALAIPLDNGRGDVFVSYCIESNYVHPTYSVKKLALDPPPFTPVGWKTWIRYEWNNWTKNDYECNWKLINGDTVEDRQLDNNAEVWPITTTVPPSERNNETVIAKNSIEPNNETTKPKVNKNPMAKRMRNSFISRKKFYQMVENKMFQWVYRKQPMMTTLI